MTLYTMIGLPGSGKSTFASNHPECIVVSTDAIRGELFGDESEQKDGKLVFDVAYARLAQAVEAGQDAIFDATNLQRKYRKKIFQMFPKAYHVAVFVNTPVDVCKERNAKRDRVVPEMVIDRMASSLNPPTIAEGFKKIIEIS